MAVSLQWSLADGAKMGGSKMGVWRREGSLRKMGNVCTPWNIPQIFVLIKPVLWKTTLSFLYFGFWEDLKYELSFILPFYMCDTWITFLFVGGFMFGICSLDFSWGGECGWGEFIGSSSTWKWRLWRPMFGVCFNFSHLDFEKFCSKQTTRWWFKTFFMFIRTCRNDPFWLIFFKWVDITK